MNKNLLIPKDKIAELLGRDVDLHTPGFLSRYFRSKILEEAEAQYAGN